MFYNGANVKQVDVPTLTGSFGILASHVPTLQVLRPGVVTVHAEDGTATKYFGERGRRSWGGKVCVGMVFLALSQGRLCPSRCGLVHFQGFLLSQPARGCWKLLWEPWAGVRSWFCSGSLGASPASASHGMGAESLNAGNVTGGGRGFVLGKDGGDAKAEPLWQPWLTHPTLCLAVSSGSVSVHADSTVQVLAEEAVTIDMLDLAVSTQRLWPALGSLPGGDLPPFSALGCLSWELPVPRTQGWVCTPITFWDQRLGAPPW